MKLNDYSGDWNPEFSLDLLEHKLLAQYGREVMLTNQLHDTSMMPHVGGRWGSGAMTAVAVDEWMGSSPVYSARNRALHGISGDTVSVILKGFQLDIGAPHCWLKFHYDLRGDDLGYFWLTSCGAYNFVREMTGADETSETQICVHMEDPTFEATVRSTHPGASCLPLYRPPYGKDAEIPEGGPCKWEVKIDRETNVIPLTEVNPYTAVIENSRAGQFVFKRTPPATGPTTADLGQLNDYSGPFKRDFCLEDLCHETLVAQVKEFSMDVHLLQRAAYSSIFDKYIATEAAEKNSNAQETLDWLLTEHWALLARLYQKRLRALFGIHGEDINALLKLIQLDSIFVPEYLELGMRKLDDARAQIWIKPCAAADDGAISGLLSGFLKGRTAGFAQWVSAVNPYAKVKPIAAQSCSEDAIHAFEVWIDENSEKAEVPAMMSLLEPNFDRAKLAEHEFYYPA